MDTATHDSSKWWARWRRRHESPDPEPDALVAAWKAAWLDGANTAWAPDRPATNPHPDGMARAAWDAGWKWAEQHPDRRANRAPRFAHPLRRATDSTLSASVRRAAAVGATGLTLYAISKVLQRWPRRARSDAP
jgi:hypothetical protein